MKANLCFSLTFLYATVLSIPSLGGEITDSCLSRITECEAIETSLESADLPISEYNGVITYLPGYRMQSAFGYTVQMTEEFFHGNGKTRTIQIPQTERATSDWKSDVAQARLEAQGRCQDRRTDLQRLYPNCR